MRFILKVLLGLGLVFAVQSQALAYVSIDVDLTSQTMHVRSGSGASYVWPISSGKEGHATPRGVFHPRALYTMVHSAKYNNAPMPHSIFFYGQYAIHGTNAVGALGRPASHGCVRLSPAAAATLFAMVQRRGRPDSDHRIAGAYGGASPYARPSRLCASPCPFAGDGAWLCFCPSRPDDPDAQPMGEEPGFAIALPATSPPQRLATGPAGSVMDESACGERALGRLEY